MHGFSPRSLKYMRRFAEIWPDEVIVQRCVAQLPWRHNIYLMEKVSEPNRRIDYENGSDHFSVRLFCGLKNDQKNRPLNHTRNTSQVSKFISQLPSSVLSH